MVDATPSSNSGLATREDATPDRAYALAWTTSDEPFFAISGTGASLVTAISAASALGVWHFVVGRYVPSVEVACFVDGVKTVNATAVPASVNASSQGFEIGRDQNDNSRIIHGKARDVFICAAALSDALIEEVRVTSVP